MFACNGFTDFKLGLPRISIYFAERVGGLFSKNESYIVTKVASIFAIKVFVPRNPREPVRYRNGNPSRYRKVQRPSFRVKNIANHNCSFSRGRWRDKRGSDRRHNKKTPHAILTFRFAAAMFRISLRCTYQMKLRPGRCSQQMCHLFHFDSDRSANPSDL